MRRHITAYLACVMVAAIAAADTTVYIDGKLTAVTDAPDVVTTATGRAVTMRVPLDWYERNADTVTLGATFAVEVYDTDDVIGIDNTLHFSSLTVRSISLDGRTVVLRLVTPDVAAGHMELPR